MPAYTRRHFLSVVGTTFGIAGLGYVAQRTGLLAGPAEAEVRHQGNLDPSTGAGRKVAVLGAGVSGLRAAWELAAGGFAVTVIEAAPYMGGRSQTIRPSSEAYRENWLTWPNQHNFPRSAYHDRLIQEKRGPDGTVETSVQVCEFQDAAWEANPDQGRPDEIYLNAGPGRIPSFHNALLDHCRKFHVALEPFTFTSRQNLLQKDGFNDGEPTKLGLIKHSLRLHIEEILSSMDPARLDQIIGDQDRAAFAAMVAAFGGGDAATGYDSSERLGYVDGKTPGAWFNNGTLRPAFSLDDILEGAAWEPGLFNDMRVYWQTSLMQPIGGMDRIWTNILTEPLPGEGPPRTIEDLVEVDAPVTELERLDTGLRIRWGKAGAQKEEVFDFCVSTINPMQLSKVVRGFAVDHPRLRDRVGYADVLSQVLYEPACKVGWQSRGRWFEDDFEIYGGISWIADTATPDDTLISQIWYPSQDFHSANATLTGAYNSGQAAVWFGALSHDARLERAARGGARLHGMEPETFRTEKVHFDTGLSVAWQDAPFQNGGWADHGFEQRHRMVVVDGVETDIPLWDVLVRPTGTPLYLAGDWCSHTPGWQEGSIRTAMAAVYAIAEECVPAEAYNGGVGGTCRYEVLPDLSGDN